MSEWISVKDKLPNNGSWVIVDADTEGTDRVVTMAFFEQSTQDGGIYWLCYDYSNGPEWEGVTHWQQLPKGVQE